MPEHRCEPRKSGPCPPSSTPQHCELYFSELHLSPRLPAPTLSHCMKQPSLLSQSAPQGSGRGQTSLNENHVFSCLLLFLGLLHPRPSVLHLKQGLSSAALPYYRSSVQRMTQKSTCPFDPQSGMAVEFISALPAQGGKFSAATAPTPPGGPGSSQHTYIHCGRLLPGEAVTKTLIIHQVWLLAAHRTEAISNSGRPEPHDKVPTLSRSQGSSPMQLATSVKDTIAHHMIHFQGLLQGCRCLQMVWFRLSHSHLPGPHLVGLTHLEEAPKI